MKIRVGTIPNEVIYEGDVKGEGMVVFLSQDDPATTVTWRLDIYVHVAQGWFLLGFLTTNTVTIDGGITARAVAFASCPGARGWKVVARNNGVVANESIDAELTIQAGLCCGGGSPYGVFHPPQPPGSGGGGGGGA